LERKIGEEGGLGWRLERAGGAECERSDGTRSGGRSSALERVADGERGGGIGERSVGAVGSEEFGGAEDILEDKRLVHASEGVHVAHHTGGAVDNGEMVTEKFLGPATDLVDLAVVFENLLHCAAITEPIKVGAPKVFAALADRPAAGASFAHKGMIVVLAVVTPARAKADRSEAGAAHQEVEEIFAACFENGKGGKGVSGIGGLHENVAHAESRPVGFEETRHGFVVAGKTGVAGAFEDAVAGLTAADWGRCAGVDAIIEAEDWADNATVVEAIPVLVDGGDKQGAELGFQVGRDSDVFVELGLVASGIP
jgi:hypothetical protein